MSRGARNSFSTSEDSLRMTVRTVGAISRRSTTRWIGDACAALALPSVLLLVLPYQYDVEVPGADESLDALFLAAVIGIAITRLGESRGAPAARRALIRVVFVALMTA